MKSVAPSDGLRRWFDHDPAKWAEFKRRYFAELDANPALVKSMSVQPPRGSGSVRTIRIGDAQTLIALQPCGGTHVANTAHVGHVVVTKIEKKSAMTRRVVLGFAEPVRA